MASALRCRGHEKVYIVEIHHVPLPLPIVVQPAADAPRPGFVAARRAPIGVGIPDEALLLARGAEPASPRIRRRGRRRLRPGALRRDHRRGQRRRRAQLPRHLDAPGEVGSLVATSDGAIAVLRGEDLLGVALEDGTAVWRRLVAPRGRLVASGRWLVYAASGLLALSDDRGATWSYQELPVGAADGSLRVQIDDDGVLRLACGGELHVGDLDGRGWKKLWTSTELVGSWGFGEGGWLYAYVGEDDERMRLVAVSPQGRASTLAGPSTPDVAVWPFQVAGNGHAAVANVADRMARLDHGKIVDWSCWGEGCSDEPPSSRRGRRTACAASIPGACPSSSGETTAATWCASRRPARAPSSDTALDPPRGRRLPSGAMYLGRVIGTVVATRKYPGLEGVPLLFVEPLDDQLRKTGEPQVAADATRQAGPQDLVYLVGSREAALALEESFVPVDAAIIGIVDQVHVE
jgi:ethanolamine utilization protein EutN